MRLGGPTNTNYWTNNDIFCRWCGGEGQREFANTDWSECKHCARTGLEGIPFTELFPNLRTGWGVKHPL